LWPPSGGSFGVRQLAAAFLQASLLAARIPELEVAASKLAANGSGSKLPHSKAGSARNPSKDEGAAFTHATK
jgi:hypothetical protein